MADKKILVFGIGTDEVVEIPYGDLPAEAEDLLEVFKAEVAPLSLWVESARAYLQAGQVQQFLQIVTEGTGKEVEDHFGASAKYERIQLLCALGSYNTTQAGLQSERTAQNAYFATASTLFSKALAVSYHELLPHLGLGQLALARVGVLPNTTYGCLARIRALRAPCRTGFMCCSETTMPHNAALRKQSDTKTTASRA